jgi:hypothetical protein
MLQDYEIEKLLVELNLPDEARRLIRFARTESPVRQVTSSCGNNIISHYSKKMGGRHLELESRTVEAPPATLYEDDRTCLEFWPQPFCIDLVIRDENGKVVTRIQHYPDYLIIRVDGIYVHEWRREDRLLRLAAEGDQFYKDDDGKWHYKAVEDYFAAIGIKYELHSSFELPREYILNTRFLEDYHSPDSPPLSEEIEATLLQLVTERGSIPFLELIQDHGYTADNIFKAVVKKAVFVDLYNDRLDATADLMIHRDMSLAKAHRIIKTERETPLPIPGMGCLSAGASVTFDGKDFKVILVGSGKVLLKDSEGKTIELPLDDVVALFKNDYLDITSTQNGSKAPVRTLADFSYEQLETAEKRLAIINGGNNTDIPARTIQNWNARIDDDMSVVDKLIALTGRTHEKGNRTPRLPEKVESLAEETIGKFFNTPECRTALATYDKYQETCEKNGVEPMSYPTFTKRVKNNRSTKPREGKRKAYQEAEIPLFLDYGDPVHGVRPHEVCYVDHTILNLANVGPEGTDLGKPTFSLSTDGNTTQARAMFLSFDPPSAKVVLMVLRDYVRRHNKLPKILVVDGGKEFRSKELKWFCRIYGIDLRHRPPGMPRGGSPVERAIGATETEVIAQMKGNTRIMKNTRMVTKSVNPFPRAEWTLCATYGALEKYLFEIRDTRIHPTLGSTPREYEAMRMLETGQREHVLVKFDENIMLLTCPHTMRIKHKIDRQRGVWADNRYYWHDDFRMVKKDELVEVRVEPWCANVVYVYYRNRWIAAITRDIRQFAGRTRREVELALRVERRLAKVNANKDRQKKLSSKKMLELWSPDKFDERIGIQQKEMIYLYTRLGMAVAMPACVPTVEDPNLAPKANTFLAAKVSNDNVTSTDCTNIIEEDPSEIWKDIVEFH